MTCFLKTTTKRSSIFSATMLPAAFFYVRCEATVILPHLRKVGRLGRLGRIKIESAADPVAPSVENPPTKRGKETRESTWIAYG